ncbi:MAG TPA: H-type small acid-soluble spore protein [Acetivibrio sp.]|uniref:H-type small acid-soluble spore protein n=1 Tax=Acetivibrio sp. TaxID=1872092 RepID=UPI002C6EF015|nr:H-type small acid-soluble spore protein [Acetivibrio sp.]HOM03777.1 H-type small acid-soluble spore protein [Acetivibrio sp.]
MDAVRAQQILKSDQIVEVLHEGAPVWIEKVMDNNMAHVSYIKTKEEKDVPLYMLVEKELPKNSL